CWLSCAVFKGACRTGRIGRVERRGVALERTAHARSFETNEGRERCRRLCRRESLEASGTLRWISFGLLDTRALFRAAQQRQEGKRQEDRALLREIQRVARPRALVRRHPRLVVAAKRLLTY